MSLTCHGRVDPPNVGQQSELRKLDTESGRFVHFLLQDFGAFIRAVERLDVEIAKRDFFGPRGVWLGEHRIRIGEQVSEQIVLDVLARQWLCVVAFDGEHLAALIAGPGGGKKETLIGQLRDRGGQMTDGVGGLGSGGTADIQCGELGCVDDVEGCITSCD